MWSGQQAILPECRATKVNSVTTVESFLNFLKFFGFFFHNQCSPLKSFKCTASNLRTWNSAVDTHRKFTGHCSITSGISTHTHTHTHTYTLQFTFTHTYTHTHTHTYTLPFTFTILLLNFLHGHYSNIVDLHPFSVYPILSEIA